MEEEDGGFQISRRVRDEKMSKSPRIIYHSNPLGLINSNITMKNTILLLIFVPAVNFVNTPLTSEKRSIASNLRSISIFRYNSQISEVVSFRMTYKFIILLYFPWRNRLFLYG